MFIFVVLVCVLLLLFFFYKNYKKLNLSAVFLIDGAVKGGKSFLSVYASVKKYKSNLFKWKILKPFRKLLGKDILPPKLYSNIPLRNVKYSPLTEDILKRKVRIPNKSVVLLDEASLIADSMSFKDNILNEELMLFIKLFGHYSHGGTCILNTQSIPDLHYNFKRCISKYLYIYKRKKFPFITIFKVREMLNSEDGNCIMNVYNEDIEDTFKNLYVLNRYYKYYDCYCYSILTDDLPIYYNDTYKKKKDSLKTNKIISFKKFLTIKKEEKK